MFPPSRNLCSNTSVLKPRGPGVCVVSLQLLLARVAVGESGTPRSRGSAEAEQVLKRRLNPKVSDEWNYRDGSEQVNIRGVANLTQVLDDWRFDILRQMRGLLENDHQSLLPDYARIQPLSEALDDLYKEFNALKTHLGDLTEKFTAMETFIDELKAGRANSPGPAGGAASGSAAAPRVTGRRLLKKKTNPPLKEHPPSLHSPDLFTCTAQTFSQISVTWTVSHLRAERLHADLSDLLNRPSDLLTTLRNLKGLGRFSESDSTNLISRMMEMFLQKH
ncbi:hypothetical protein OJAV_G00083590 [Oryzias javanicus]|uniref:Uncharacterized protein n=1 Tax=Oryzias javanicus TaxID=123683 RepID=A0A3S2M8I2_ORYJA|nr:hypothetical protein OJAV_G00083590 [Oryzias javanicus]